MKLSARLTVCLSRCYEAKTIVPKKLLPVVAALLCLLCPAAATSQEADSTALKNFDLWVSNTRHIGLDDGLNSNAVKSIFCDGEGMMWIGTDAGLNTYDGYDITQFNHDSNDPNSIAGKQVVDICILAQHRIYVALADGGVDYYDREKRKFVHPFVNDVSLSNKSVDVSACYGLCSADAFGFLVFPQHVVKMNSNDNTTDARLIKPQFLSASYARGRARTVCVNGKNKKVVVLNSAHSISVVDVAAVLKTDEMLPTITIRDICAYDNSRVLLATAKGLYLFDIDTHRTEKLPLLPEASFMAVSRNSVGEFWFSYNGDQLLKWNPSQRRTSKVCYTNDQKLTMQTRVNDLYEDENGLLWVATNNNGLYMFDTKKRKIEYMYLASLLQRRLSTLDMVVRDGVAWSACGGTGVIKVRLLDKATEEIRIPGRRAFSVCPRKDGTVLIGTDRGLVRYTDSTHSLENINSQQQDTTQRLMIRYIGEDNLGNAWLCTNKGLQKFNGVSVESVAVEGKGDGLTFNCVYEDSRGCIWAGACTGVYLKTLDSDTFRPKLTRWTERATDGVFCINEYNGKIALGTSDGLIFFDMNTQKQVEYPLARAFENRNVYSVCYDESGNLWLNTSAGVGYINGGSKSVGDCVEGEDTGGRVFILDHNDGLYYDGNDCHRFSKERNESGNETIYFGQAAIVNYIETSNLNFNLRPPTIFISEAYYGTSTSRAPMQMSSDSVFVCKYVMNASCEIKVATSDYTNPRRNVFRYRVDGEPWVQLEGNGNIALPGRLPGTYRLDISATNADQTDCRRLRTLIIHIETPLWAKTELIVLYVFILMAIVWLLLNLRFRNISDRMKLAEAEAKSKVLVEEQRNKLAHVINEYNSSLNYAKRIQDALMPKTDSVEKYFVKLFVVYRPKEIVSGDFYCFFHRDGKTFVISSDCTGHGVPGSFISILGIDHLRNIIMLQKVDDAGEILTRLHAELHSAVSKLGSDQINDGMDITIAVVDHDNMRINFGGAMNDLFLIRSNEVLQYKGDRMSIGAHMSMDDDEPEPTFHSQDIQCEPGDMLYLFSDGYIDQFGGPERKKFKVRRFKNLLLNVHKLPATDQKFFLNRKLEEWKGVLEQTDDVSVIGFEPWPYATNDNWDIEGVGYNY